MGVSRVQTLVLLGIALVFPGCNSHWPQPKVAARKVAVAVVQSKSITIKQSYNGRISAYRGIEVRTPADGHLAAIPVKEGQAVKKGDLLFRIGSPMDEEKPEAENRGKVVSIKAPFDGLVGPLPHKLGRFVREGDLLTTFVSDNSKLAVVFDVPENHYIEYFLPMLKPGEGWRSLDVELILEGHRKYPHAGKIIGPQARFHAEIDHFTFRAEFPNPDGLLLHGQTGTLLINLVLKDAILIPERAAFEDYNGWYVYVVDEDHVAHRRKIVIRREAEDQLIIKEGVAAGDRIVLEAVGWFRDGDKVE